MVEIPDSLQHKDNETIYSKASWKHGVDCSDCKTSIVGERFFCVVLCGRYRVSPSDRLLLQQELLLALPPAQQAQPRPLLHRLSPSPQGVYHCM